MKLRLGHRELTRLIHAMDCMLQEPPDKEDIKLLKKLSKELHKKGYTSLISKHYLE